MEPKPTEMVIQNKIDKAVELLNKKEVIACDKLITDIFEMITEKYGTPHDVCIGIITNEYNEIEYVKPTLHNILESYKYEAYTACVEDLAVRISWRLNDIIHYFHSCLALHYFEILAKVPDELKGEQT